MRIIICAFFLVFATQSLFSQTSVQKAQIDSLDKQLKEDSLKIYRFRKLRPFLNYHNRNSINEIKPVNFYGFQVGAVFFERHIAGYGRYFSTAKTRRPYKFLENGEEITRTVNINYHTVFYQFIFLSQRWFEIHVPVELGYGTIRSKYSALSNPSGWSATENMFMTAYGLQVILKPVRWCGITGNFGYRGSSEKLVNGFYYAVGFWIGLKPVMEDYNYYLVKRARHRKAKAAILKN